MAALTDGQRDTLYNLFRMNDFKSMFMLLSQEYKTLGFTDHLTDSERIKEFQYITQQLRKYIATRQDPILACGSNVDEMIRLVEDWISGAREYGSDRKELVYNFVRDSWLLELYNGLQYIKEESEEDE